MTDPVSGPSVWTRQDAEASSAWRFRLDDELADSVAQAAREAAAAADDPANVSAREFHLPQLAALFESMHASAESGIGFALLEGLPFDQLDYGQQVALTLGLSDNLGQVVVQNYEGQRIVDVRDEGIAYNHRSRGYRGNKLLPFHTDGANLFTLTCLGQGATGGETIITSAAAVFNRLAEEFPQTLEILQRGFFHHRRGQHDPGENPLSDQRVPVFSVRNGLLHCCYNRNPIEWATREGIELSSQEIAALDALDEVLARPELQLRLQLEPGQSLLINNFITLHARTEYRDGPGKRRHMLRVWMNDAASARSGFSLLQLYVPERLRPHAVI